MSSDQRAERIARLNDELRTRGRGGQLLVTSGVEASPYMNEIVEAVQRYKFQGVDENNPYGENDWGAVAVEGEKYFFKIDYYDPTMTAHSEDEADPKKTRRVMTIMRAEEW